MNKYIKAIRAYSKENYIDMVRAPKGLLKEPFIVPGSASYDSCLWDWDSWLTNIAVRQIMLDNGDYNEDFVQCEKGCILNFLEYAREDGGIPIVILPDRTVYFEENGNIHKPCLAQHAAFVSQVNGGDCNWLRPHMGKMKLFLDCYRNHYHHKPTGLYVWATDGAIGVDNDPCTFYRPAGSSASIFLNCMMYKELLAFIWICEQLEIPCEEYKEEAAHLKEAVRTHLWDERDGFYYSADVNLLPVDTSHFLHSGAPRNWHCLIQRIDVWSGMMAMWAGIADDAQAVRMVSHIMDKRTFWAPYGVRTLSKLEKMYQIVKTGNPSCWLGPIWGISNWMCFIGMVEYGFQEEARELAEKTIGMFGTDVLSSGKMHEYYHPDSGVGVNNPGFLNWNLLVNNMIAWYCGETFVKEF